MPSPFYNARLTEFTAQVRMWPVVITVPAPVVATSVATTKVISATLLTNGSGGPTGIPGNAPISGTTGTGTKVVFTGSFPGNGTLASISLGGLFGNGGGSYTVNPTNLSSEPLSGTWTVAPTVSLVMGPDMFNTSAGDLTATCIMTPEKERMTMMGNNYQKVIEVTVDILREDWETLGLAPTASNPRPRFTTASGVVYEQQSHNDDENEPTVQLVARRVQ